MIDEGTVKKYKADLADEIEPQINELIDHAEQGLKSLRRKEGLIQSKVCRIARVHVWCGVDGENQVEAARALQSCAATAPTATKREERRVQMLSRQRQRLEEEARVLESEILALVRSPCHHSFVLLTTLKTATEEIYMSVDSSPPFAAKF